MPLAVDAQRLHPTTQSCLEALEWLHHDRTFHNVLDMGCGSGILSILSAGIWEARVLAVDISPKAIDDIKQSVEENGLGHLITPVRSDGFTEPVIRQRAPYDLILFNLLAEPIIQMAPLVKSHLSPGGVCILSGILAWLDDMTRNTYLALGFDFIKTFKNEQWLTHVLCHKSETHVFGSHESLTL